MGLVGPIRLYLGLFRDSRVYSGTALRRLLGLRSYGECLSRLALSRMFPCLSRLCVTRRTTGHTRRNAMWPSRRSPNNCLAEHSIGGLPCFRPGPPSLLQDSPKWRRARRFSSIQLLFITGHQIITQGALLHLATLVASLLILSSQI